MRIPVSGFRLLEIGAHAVVALSVVLLPWFALAAYEPNGWDATWWARAALVLSGAAIVMVRGRAWPPAVLAVSAAALVCVLVRLVWPPDFGFGFGGLDVGTERRAGVWVAAAAATVAVLLSAVSARTGASASGSAPAPDSGEPG